MDETSGVQEPEKSKNGDSAASSTKSPAAAPPPDELTTASACSNDDDLLVPTEKSHIHSDDESGNLLEESSYVPDDELDIEDHLKRKIGLSDDEPSSEGHFKKSKNNFYDDDDEADEEDDEFDEDDDDEFEIERHGNVHPFVNVQNRHAFKAFESDVDSLVDDLSDGGVKSELDKSMSENGETLNISDILGEAGDDLSIDKTVKLSDIVVDPLVFSKQIGRKVKLHRGDVDDDDDDDDDDENEDDEDPKDEEELDFDISEKLKDMGEISVQPVSKTDSKTKKDFDLGDEVSLEITKKNASDTEDKRKISNLRKNIREVMDDNQLDASTLAAQREELERLARVQEQQRIIREVQRQIVMERQNSKTQNRVLSLLQGRSSSLLKSTMNSGASSSKVPFPDESTTLTKLMSSETMPVEHSFNETRLETNRANLTPSVSIAPVRPPVLKRDRIDVPEDDKKDQPVEQTEVKPKKDIVTIVDSSDDDCIVLSDDDEVPEEDDDPQNSGLHVNDTYNVPDDQGRVVINIGHPEGESDIYLAPQIARVIKPHQIGGVRFLFDNIIESVERFSTSSGFGCILAHSMGLGKTLQLVCFCDIFLRHTNSKTILCIMPINTLQNWMAEFNMWLPEDPDKSPMSSSGEVRPRNFNLYVLNDTHKTLNARSKVVLEWAEKGGVLLMGYELYRLLSMKKVAKKRGRKVYRDPEVEKEEAEEHKKLLDEMHAALVKPGPDLIVCDEGHRIKNSHAGISVALKQIRSKRRIVLTGYPLQNNLLEYWCMVDFVRPNYLGTKTEFSNMFERPIQNGQCIDSTPQDIKLMRYRAHVLHSLLLGFVQRRSHVVLQNSLPQKEEYVLLVRMTPFQRDLYEVFMNEIVRVKAVPNPLKAFAVCCKIWNHPDVLYNFLKKREADLDLEEAEAAANDPTYEPPIGCINESSNSSNQKLTKGSKKKLPTAPKEKKPRKNARPEGSKPRSRKAKAKPEATIPPTSASETKVEDVKPIDSKPELVLPKIEPKVEPQCGTNEVKKEAFDSSYGNPSQNEQFPSQPYNFGYNNFGYDNYDSNNYYGNGNYNNPGQNNPMQSQPSNQNYYPNQNYDSNYQQNAYSQNLPPPPPPQQNYWQNNQNYYPNQSEYHQGQMYSNYGSTDYNNPNAYPPQQAPPSMFPTTNSSSNYPQNEWNNSGTNNDLPIKTEPKPSQIVDLDTKEIKVEAVVDVKEETKVKIEEIKEEIVEKDIKPKDDGIPYDWAVELMKNYVPDLIENSPKMEIFFCILKESLRLGDRMLVFSQSLLTLNLIEKFLQANTVNNTDIKWAKNLNYYRLDGSTAAQEREKLINEFNSNPNIHLFLVSTRAGSLGINLVGANRVVVFDASWNPCHDTQAVCRVYRYGQKKPCFVYRLVMDSCLEKKIYDRQVNKQGMSDRVVDECNPDAHLSLKEVTSLCWDDEKVSEIRDFSDCKEKYLDIVMQKIIESFSKRMSKEPFQHESLLIDRKEKKLSMAEKRLAQRGYELEKQAAIKPNYDKPGSGMHYRTMRTPDGAIVHRPVASVRPMQAEIGGDRMRTGPARPTRWIPAEVWQRQGMTAQVLTLPGDVVIPTSSAEKSNIVLKEGQKVMVLKSPKGIYMQLETGKIIAIRTSFKMGQGKEKSPSGLIGREFNEKRPNLMRPLGPIPTEKMPNLKNADNIGVPANKPGRPPGSVSQYNRGPPVPFATHTPGHGNVHGPAHGTIHSHVPNHGPTHASSLASSPTRPVSLLQKPRPNAPNASLMKNRMPQNVGNKNIQLGTARPYNLKQGPRLPIKNMRSSQMPMPTSSNSNSSFEGESSNEAKYFERQMDEMKQDAEMKKPIEPSNKVEVISQEVIRKADVVDRDETTSGNSNDDVIMISADDKPKPPVDDGNPFNYNYGNNAPYYNNQGYQQQRTPYPQYNQQQQQSHQQQPIQQQQQQQQSLPQQHPYYNQYPQSQQMPQQMPQHHHQPHQLHPPSHQNYDYSSPMSTLSSTAPSPSVSHSYSSPSPSTIQSPTPTAMITIEDDQPLREKVVYKPNLVERKGKSSKKGADKFNESYQQPMNSQPHNYPQQHQMHQYPNQQHQLQNQQLHPQHQQQQQQHQHQQQQNQQLNPHHQQHSQQYHPPLPSPTNNSLKNYRHKASKLSPNSEDFHYNDNSNIQDSETSLSFLERTASSINENQSVFNASLSDITKPPPMVSPAVIPATKSKAKPRSKAAAAPKKPPKAPKQPAEPKPPKEKSKTTKKTKNANVPVPAPLPSAGSLEHNSNSSSSSYPGSEQTGTNQQINSQLPPPPLTQPTQHHTQIPMQQPSNTHSGYNNYPPQQQSYANYPPPQQHVPPVHSQPPNDQAPYAPYPPYNMGYPPYQPPTTQNAPPPTSYPSQPPYDPNYQPPPTNFHKPDDSAQPSYNSQPSTTQLPNPQPTQHQYNPAQSQPPQNPPHAAYPQSSPNVPAYQPQHHNPPQQPYQQPYYQPPPTAYPPQSGYNYQTPYGHGGYAPPQGPPPIPPPQIPPQHGNQPPPSHMPVNHQSTPNQYPPSQQYPPQQQQQQPLPPQQSPVGNDQQNQQQQYAPYQNNYNYNPYSNPHPGPWQ
ncbi:uncharacterized protein LOC119073821 [Bradysia coprophila]|uniref:uncharacterized protein LOC119073821 n=1 Tax=Bradysia coprophila TaxID=38358 RepID=UPI00187D9A98|nr:uncharacterized protein LOC119073821 [Bradysia coprophila]